MENKAQYKRLLKVTYEEEGWVVEGKEALVMGGLGRE